MKKFFDILIIFLLVFLTVSLFNKPDERKKEKSDTVISFIESTYTIPASVQLNVENNWTWSLKINTCTDLKITSLNTPVILDKKDCKDIVLWVTEKKTIDLSSSYKSFLKTWDYILSTKISWVDYVSVLKIENKWSISKIFSTLVYAPIYNLLIFLLSIFNSSLGYAIITVTILIRLLLLWPQHKMMVSQRKLQAIQPKIKALQEEYKWNNQVLGMKMMELYKKEKVNPMGSCWFMLIQMPILLVIYNVILYIKDESHAYYIYSMLGDFNISSIIYNFYWLDLLWVGWITWGILWFIVWIVQYIQIKLSITYNAKNTTWVVLEKKKWENDYSSMMPDADTMNKFMLYVIPVVVWISTFMFPAWLGIYWLITTIFMIAQQLVVNKIIKK